MKKVDREFGYYWVKIKRTGIWIIAKWMPTYQWFTCMLENDTRSGFSEVDEHRIIHKEKTIKRTRRIKNDNIKVHRQRRRRTHN